MTDTDNEGEFGEFDTPPEEVAAYLRGGNPVRIVPKDERVSLYGLDPEEALRAMLKPTRRLGVSISVTNVRVDTDGGAGIDAKTLASTLG